MFVQPIIPLHCDQGCIPRIRFVDVIRAAVSGLVCSQVHANHYLQHM